MTRPILPPPGPPADAVRRAKADFLGGLEQSLPVALPRASQLLERIATPNWALEWGLSHWMAEAYGLQVETAQNLLLSNVSLLAYARVLDDLADGETDEPVGDAVVLAAALQQQWTKCYLGMFEGEQQALFWSYFDEFNARWLRAMLPSPGDEPVPESERGALLRVACAAGCLVADREEALSPLVHALDHLLVAVVLLDDAFDWESDLLAGRHNALVSFCSTSPQTGENQETNRAAVLHGVYVDDVLPGYFAVARERLRSAYVWCERADCSGLGSFVTWYDGEIDACSRWMRARVHRQVLAWAGTRQRPPV